MEPLRFLRGKVAPLDSSDVDTDQIIPKQFMKRIERTGFGNFLFYNWRFDKDGNLIPDFPLNKELYREATILIARRNFGTGSSREHAVWALKDFGFRVVISSKFGEIFYNNALKNGLLPVVLPENIIDYLFEKVYELEKLNKNYFLDVDVEKQIIKDDFGFSASFEIDEFRKYCLIEGLDDIALTLKYEEKIREYEEKIEKLYPHRSLKKLEKVWKNPGENYLWKELLRKNHSEELKKSSIKRDLSCILLQMINFCQNLPEGGISRR